MFWQRNREDLEVCFNDVVYVASYYVLLPLGNVSISMLLIGYYHGLLLRDIKADSLIEKMLSAKLLNAYEEDVVLSGHSLHHRNWILLEYVRHLDLQSLKEFIELVKEKWPQIGFQLTTGTYIIRMLDTNTHTEYL